MKFNIVLDITDSDEMLSAYKHKSELIRLFQSKMKLTGIAKKDLTVEDAELLEYIPIKECGFPEGLVNCLLFNNIVYLDELRKFDFSYIYELTESAGNGKAYICKLSSVMQKHGISYRDTDIDDIIPVRCCGFTSYTDNALERRGYYYLQQVAALTREQMIMTPNIGKKTIAEIEDKLKEYGMSFSKKEQPELLFVNLNAKIR